ncbi:hypothetical protein [Actinoplanes regularis]|uniref:Phage integrase family protein n=1 Tax=Actinoplanes regularis TaxID=52697 RepID=A0A239AXP5_9ACTN|nr:hypothetical protein [Actinoplanes regularis]GIE87284.1 hypothetical protein Are01nite_37640 [Actinoplanes regularis]SNS00475.1 hypothetical protein SAMN06264365_108198 [Actinoplanes regularis]
MVLALGGTRPLAALRRLLCGLRWAAVDLDRELLFVERQPTTAGYTVVKGEPKTAAGRRAVALDKHTVQVLRAHRSRQLAHRDKRHGNGQVWIDSGYVFTRKDGEPINPSYATTRFRILTNRWPPPRQSQPAQRHPQPGDLDLATRQRIAKRAVSAPVHVGQ